MRNFLSRAFVVAGVALALASCGGGDSGSVFDNPPAPQSPNNPNTPAVPTAATVTVVSSTPTLPSNGASPVQLTAYVRDANNQFLENQTVTFTADSGGLQIVDNTTDATGAATATLTTAGDPSNRDIRVTAAVGTVSGSTTVSVAGSQLSIQGPSALVVSQSASYTVALIDSGNGGVANRTVTLSSARGNTLSSTSLTTNAAGQASFNLTVANSGNDTITATAIGLTATLNVAVNSDSFGFSVPAVNQEIQLATSVPLTVRWTSNGAPVVGQTVSFASTRGTLSAPTAITNASGDATVNITSMNAGGAVITASGTGGASTQRNVEFVATTPAAIDVQPTQFSIAPNEVSTLTAIVRDAAGNLVKNQTVLFSLQDVTGGTLSTASAVTDSQGRAQTAYTAGSVTSAADGVVVTATVQGTAINDTVRLTVSQRQLFLVLGTGNEIEEPNTAQYRLEYVVQVTDAGGNGVSGVPLTLSVLSTRYFKGYRSQPSPNGDWITTVTAVCSDEDLNNNGVLDAGEDFNSSGRIEAGNVTTVTGTATTGAGGFAQIFVSYPQDHAYYVEVRLEARASVQGSEFARSSTFILPGEKSDFEGSQSPPGPFSPFGVAAVCTDPG